MKRMWIGVALFLQLACFRGIRANHFVQSKEKKEATSSCRKMKEAVDSEDWYTAVNTFPLGDACIEGSKHLMGRLLYDDWVNAIYEALLDPKSKMDPILHYQALRIASLNYKLRYDDKNLITMRGPMGDELTKERRGEFNDFMVAMQPVVQQSLKDKVAKIQAQVDIAIDKNQYGLILFYIDFINVYFNEINFHRNTFNITEYNIPKLPIVIRDIELSKPEIKVSLTSSEDSINNGSKPTSIKGRTVIYTNENSEFNVSIKVGKLNYTTSQSETQIEYQVKVGIKTIDNPEYERYQKQIERNLKCLQEGSLCGGTKDSQAYYLERNRKRLENTPPMITVDDVKTEYITGTKLSITGNRDVSITISQLGKPDQKIQKKISFTKDKFQNEEVSGPNILTPIQAYNDLSYTEEEIIEFSNKMILKEYENSMESLLGEISFPPTTDKNERLNQIIMLAVFNQKPISLDDPEFEELLTDLTQSTLKTLGSPIELNWYSLLHWFNDKILSTNKTTENSTSN